mgnify:CR=1 FL=1
MDMKVDEVKRVLVLGGPVFQVPVVERVKELGHYVGVVDINENAPAAAHADVFYRASLRDFEAVLQCAQEFRPDGVVCGACDTSVPVAAHVCEMLGLPGNDTEAAARSTDKVRMLEAFAEHGIEHPSFQVIPKAQISHFETKIGFPAVSKPTDSAGGRGVYYIPNVASIRAAVAASSAAGVSGDVLIEEYMDGPEVSVEVLIVDGTPHVLQITDKYTSGAPNFYEIGHSQPSVLSEEVKARVSNLAARAVMAVGLENSPSHVEIKITSGGPKMVELGARMGGDCISTYLLDNSVTGVRMTDAAIMLALGEKVRVSSYSNSGQYVVSEFIPSQKGRLTAIEGAEGLQNMPGIIYSEILGKIGACYDDAKDDSSRFGYVVASGVTLDEAKRNAKNAVDSVEFILE